MQGKSVRFRPAAPPNRDEDRPAAYIPNSQSSGIIGLRQTTDPAPTGKAVTLHARHETMQILLNQRRPLDIGKASQQSITSTVKVPPPGNLGPLHRA